MPARSQAGGRLPAVPAAAATAPKPVRVGRPVAAWPWLPPWPDEVKAEAGDCPPLPWNSAEPGSGAGWLARGAGSCHGADALPLPEPAPEFAAAAVALAGLAVVGVSGGAR